jgi:hypothetical protein
MLEFRHEKLYPAKKHPMFVFVPVDIDNERGFDFVYRTLLEVFHEQRFRLTMGDLVYDVGQLGVSRPRLFRSI